MTLNVPPPFDLLFLSDTQIAKPKGLYLVPWASSVLSHLLERYNLAPAFLRRVWRLLGGDCRGGFHEAADLLSRTSLHIVGDVRVGVQSEPSAVMAQHTGQGLHIHAAGDRHGRECVSEVMKAHVLLDACAFQQLPVDPRRGVRTPVTACAGRREQDGVVRVLFMLLLQQREKYSR